MEKALPVKKNMENQLAVTNEPVAALVADDYNENRQLLFPLPTERGWALPDDISFYEWMEAGKFLVRSRDALDFWRADYIEKGRKLFGNDRVKEALQQLEFEMSDFKRAQLLAGITLRDPDLKPEHHFILAKANLDDIGRDMWAGLAKQNKLSAAELQESIKKGTVTRIQANDGDGSAGVSTWQGLVMQFSLMRRQVGDEWAEWTAAKIDAVLGKLHPIAVFISDLQFRKRDLASRDRHWKERQAPAEPIPAKSEK